MSLAWNHDRSKKDTYVNDSLRHESCIDHFIVSLNIYRRIVQNRVLCDPINVSSHHTVLFEFECCINTSHCDGTDDNTRNIGTRIMWHKATTDNLLQYAATVDVELERVAIPYVAIKCNNVRCSTDQHINDFDQLCNAVVNSCTRTGQLCIPQEEIQPLKDSALFWHWIWRECVKRNNGAVYDVMRRTRHRYHYAMRAAKNRDFDLRKQRLAEACSEHNTKDMWRELKSK